MTSRKPVVLLVFGEGGHCTAMHRLVKQLSIPSDDCIQLIEAGSIPLHGIPVHYVTRIMPKRPEYWRYIAVPGRLVSNLFMVSWLFLRYDVRSVLTTGPGIAVFPALFARILSKKIIFLESWCRFEKISYTGHILARLGATIYVQNIELLSKLQHLRFSGRL